MNGFEILETRLRNEVINLNQIEDEFGIQIPPMLRQFWESFKFKEDLVQKQFFYFPDLSVGDISFPFIDPASSIRSVINNGDEELIENKLILIATSRFGIYVGTVGDDVDKVITMSKSTSNSFKVLSNNIFDFFRGITDSLNKSAKSAEEFSSWMVALGFSGDDLDYEVESWKKIYNGKI